MRVDTLRSIVYYGASSYVMAGILVSRRNELNLSIERYVFFLVQFSVHDLDMP